MKYIVLISLIILSLKANQAIAVNLPVINNTNKVYVEFSDSSQEELLKPLIEQFFKKMRSERKRSGVKLALNKIARVEKEYIEKLLRSEGFYAAKINYEIKAEDVYYRVDSGSPYFIDKANIRSKLKKLPPIEEFGLKAGERFRADNVLSAADNLKKYLEKNYCLWEIKVDYEAIVNHDNKRADIALIIADSHEVVFGYISFNGLTTINDLYLKNKLSVAKGECFKRSKIEKSKINLFQTGLLSNVESNIERKKEVVNVIFDITERKHRTIKAGGGISSDEGASLSTGWEHRNILGKAQKLQVNGRVSKLFRRVDTKLTIPSFFDSKQSLILSSEILEENLKAFDATSTSLSAILKRKFNKHLTGSIGSKLKLTNVEENNQDETFGLASFSVAMDYDKRDNILNPKKGWLISAEVSPFVDMLDTSIGFIKSSVGGSAYYTSEKTTLNPTFALRGAVGSISGLNTDDIPADERFYAGGGGSVRGYSFQKLGPLEAGDPIGGRSFLEMSFETRARISKDWGGVVFLDGGNAYDDIAPDFSEGVRWAYGAGVRYYTDFAPLRFDVAVPLERRRGIDDSFQFYISIGQAF